MNDQVWLYIAMGSGFLALAVAFYLYFWVQKQDAGSERAQEVASWIEEGARSYLKKLYTALTLVAVVMAVVLALVFGLSAGEGLVVWKCPLRLSSAPSAPPWQDTWA